MNKQTFINQHNESLQKMVWEKVEQKIMLGGAIVGIILVAYLLIGYLKS